MLRRLIVPAVFALYVAQITGCSSGGTSAPAASNVTPPPAKDASGNKVKHPSAKVD